MAVSRFQLTAVYEVVEDGWVQAQIAELPGVITVAPTKAEAAELLHDAFREYVLALDAGDAMAAIPEEGDVLEVALSSRP